MILLWGPSSAGKTALLSYLYLRSTTVDRNWEIYPTATSIQEVMRQSQRIETENLFPVGTMTADEREISYRFYNKSTGKDFLLETKDRAGINYEGAMEPQTLASLNAAEGIVLFLDSSRGQGETEIILALSQMYVERTKDKVEKDIRPLAVCLSKVDQLIDTPEDYKRLNEKPEEFVQRHLGEDLKRSIAKFHSNVKYFPVSSVGIRLNYGSVQKSVFLDERLTLRVTKRGTPINIVEPFTWIFENLREVV